MAPVAVFGITNDGLNLAVNLLLLFLAVLWLALVYWTYADAKRRTTDPMLVGCATLAALFPFAGTLVYMVVRPPEYLEDVHERELEIAAAEARLAAATESACPYCEYPVERSFLRCPSCLRRLKEPCGTCGKPLDPRWRICPYCEAEAPGAQAQAQAQAQRRRQQRPREAGADQPRTRPKARPRADAQARPPSDPQAAEPRPQAARAERPERAPERDPGERAAPERATPERPSRPRKSRPPARQ